MAKVPVLFTTQGPWVLQSSTSLKELNLQIRLHMSEGTEIVELSGRLMRDEKSFYDELAHKFQFPNYFGRNLNALDECLTDLEWLNLTGRPLVVIVAESELLLRNDSELFEAFISIMQSVGQEWSTAIEEGQLWDRPPTPFHVVLSHTEPGAFDAYKVPQLLLT